MELLTKDIKFNVNNGDLWINIIMSGLVRMDYQWDLLSNKASEPFRLTNNSRIGNNKSPHDDYYVIINDKNPGEPIINMDQRYIDLTMGIIGSSGDAYQFNIEIKQGIEYSTATLIDTLSNTAGSTIPAGQNYISYKCDINLIKI